MIIKRNELLNEEYSAKWLRSKFKHILFAKIKSRYIAVVSNSPIYERGYCIIRESRRLSSYEQHMNNMLNGNFNEEMQRTYRVDLEVIPEESTDSFNYEVYEMLGG